MSSRADRDPPSIYQGPWRPMIDKTAADLVGRFRSIRFRYSLAVERNGRSPLRHLLLANGHFSERAREEEREESETRESGDDVEADECRLTG